MDYYKVGDAVEWAADAGKEYEVISSDNVNDTYVIQLKDGPKRAGTLDFNIVHGEALCPWQDTLFGYPFPDGAMEQFKERNNLNWSKFAPGEKVMVEGRAAKIISTDTRHNPWSQMDYTYYMVEFDNGGRAEVPQTDVQPLANRGCECGAKYTTFANMHMHYCPLAPKKEESKK